MLAGIKKGKRKRKTKPDSFVSPAPPSSSSSSPKNDTDTSSNIHNSNNDNCDANKNKNHHIKRSKFKKVSSTTCGIQKNANNKDAAEELRRMLSGIQSGNSTSTTRASSSNCDDPRLLSNNNNNNSGNYTSSSNSNNPSMNDISSAIDRFEKRRGRNTKNGDILAVKNKDHGCKTEEEETVIMMDPTFATASATTGKPPILSKEDFRRGARKGKVKQKTIDSSYGYMHSSADKTISQMVQEEKQSKQQQQQGMDEIFARNVARMGSRYKGTDFQMVAGSTAGADEDDGSSIDMKMFTSVSNRITDSERYNRELSRQLAYTKKQNSIANKCWWWVESEMFQKHRLIALGDHVSLILVPSHLQLVPNQCYLVPIQHSEAFVSCEDEVWDEIQRFQTSLRTMFHKEEKMGVLFCETILPTKSLWQARIDVIPVPLNIEQDAEIFFKSALNEQAEEWGTHTKLLSTKGKSLRQTIPKGFSYFNIEWNGGGFAQIIETSSFPKDFGIDTIAGMMELDPLRFGRKRKATDQDKGAVMNFVTKWKPHDWTLALDGET